MTDDLDKPSVLVLNRNWQAVNTRNAKLAFCMLATGVATALDIDGENMIPVKWDDWLKLPVREQDAFVRTTRGAVRVPTVIVLASYAKVPKTRPRFSTGNVRKRDGGICMYTGRKLKDGEGNIDHVIPVSRGGKTSWDNCVYSDKKINSMKADKLPEEVGLKLIKKPEAPKLVPVSLQIKNTPHNPDWEHFLINKSTTGMKNS